MHGLTFDWTVNLGNVLTIAGFVIVVAAGWFELRNRSLNNLTAVRRLDADMETLKRQAEVCRDAATKAEQADRKAELLGVENRLTREQLYEFREKVAGSYVSIPILGDFRNEMNENFRQISERLDRVFARREQ